MFDILINGRRCQAKEGMTILDVARENGIDIPTLCHHEAVEAFGGCRLCMVEVAQGKWKKLVTACLFPVEPNIHVLTDTPEVLDVRRSVLDLLLARCPDAGLIRELASLHGIRESSFPTAEEPTTCILCTLCTRVCAAQGIFAISPAGRGVNREISTPLGEAPPDCTGCLACAHICPTDHIPYEEVDGLRKIWGREFDMVRCQTCGTPLITREQSEWAQKKSGLDEEYFTRCQECKRNDTAQKFRSVTV